MSKEEDDLDNTIEDLKEAIKKNLGIDNIMFEKNGKLIPLNEMIKNAKSKKKEIIEMSKTAVKETVTLEVGVLRRFRMSNNGFGYPTYPPVIRVELGESDKWKEVCRYDSIEILGDSRIFYEIELNDKGIQKPRMWIETEAEVIATMPLVEEVEEIEDNEME